MNSNFINFVVSELVLKAFENNEKIFIEHFVNRLHKVSNYATENYIKESVLEYFNRFGFFDKDSFKENPYEQAAKVFMYLSSLPKIYKQVITEQRFNNLIDFNYTFIDFFETCILQHEKGVEKYGTTIDACEYDNYNWQKMALEEIVDMLVYEKKGKNGN